MTRPSAPARRLLAPALLGLAVAGCGGDPLWWVPRLGGPIGVLDLGETFNGGCAYLWLETRGSYQLVLPAGWTVESTSTGSYLQPPAASALGIPTGAMVRIHGEAGGEPRPDCHGDPFVIEDVEVVARPD